MIRKLKIFKINDEWIEIPVIPPVFLCEQCHGFTELYFLGSLLLESLAASLFLVTALQGVWEKSLRGEEKDCMSWSRCFS